MPAKPKATKAGAIKPEAVGDAWLTEPVKALGRGTVAAAKHPKLLLGPTILGAGVFAIPQGILTLSVGGLCMAPAVWATVHHESFRQVGCTAVRDRWRRATVYQPIWDRAMTGCSLMKRDAATALIPELKGVAGSEFFDHVWVRMLPGQKRSMFSEASEQLAATFGADACRVHKVPRRRWQRGTRIRLDFQRRDALAAIVPPIPIPVDEPVDLEAIPVGLTEYGEPWLLALLGTHLLCGGATGSGKASVLWSILRGIAPAVRDGKVELWGFDAKNGMELEWGRELFLRFWGKGADIPQMAVGLRELVKIMEERSDRLAGATRKHEPTIADPLIVCIIDEAADLTTYEDKKVRDQINGDISKILRRGRSVGITLALFMQDPRKEAIPFRSLIPNGIGLRMKDIYEIDAILGPGAYKAGADCTDIPGAAGTDQPVDGRGVAFVTRLGETTPLRVRASFVTDEDIGEMALEYPAFKRRDVSDDEQEATDDD